MALGPCRRRVLISVVRSHEWNGAFSVRATAADLIPQVGWWVARLPNLCHGFKFSKIPMASSSSINGILFENRPSTNSAKLFLDMRRISFRGLVVAVFLLWLGHSSPAASVTDTPSVRQGTPLARPFPESREVLRPKKQDSDFLGKALPRTGLLVALVRWGLTSLGVFDISSRQVIPMASGKETGPLMVSLAPNLLAYAVREGPNPARNTVEIIDWRHGKSLVLQPANDYALLGFALDPEGKRLSYAAMNLRASRSTNVIWHIGLADLERGETHLIVNSNSHKAAEEGIPVPFAWSSQSKRIYLQGWLPFRGMVRQSIWSMSPDGTNLTKIIAGPDSVGVPRLSPDGLRLGYLSAELDKLPPDYLPAPGPPPGNVLSVIDLVGESKATWARAGEGAFGAFGWSAAGEDLLVSAQAWSKGQFRDVDVRRIGKATSLSVTKIHQAQSLVEVTDIMECGDRTLFWVEKDLTATKLYASRERNSQVVFDFPDGAIQLLGCVNQ